MKQHIRPLSVGGVAAVNFCGGGERSSAKLVRSGPLAQRLVQRTHNVVPLH